MRPARWCSLILALALFAGFSVFAVSCGDADTTDDDDDATPDDDDDNDDDNNDNDDVAPSENAALVFPINPYADAAPVELELSDVADDADGHLTSAADQDGIRRLRIFTCVDEGETVAVIGGDEQRICTLRQLADKNAHGDFRYDDWQNAAGGVYDDGDVSAEVSLYYHLSKIYDFVTAPEVGVFDLLPGRHEANGELLPVNAVANYRLPVTAGDLRSAALAFFVPREYLQMGMDAVDGLMGYDGDFLVFGQGENADFAFDGETVYHEFGHLIAYAVAGLEYNVYPDRYGLCNLTNALEQGITETFVALVSGRSALFDYIDYWEGPGFRRDVDNDNLYPRDLEGIDPFDGMIVAGANWQAWLYMRDEAGLSEQAFMRLLLLTLSALDDPQLEYDFVQYAETFLATMDGEGWSARTEAVRGIFEDRGLFAEVRAKDITAYQAADDRQLYIGGALAEMWNTTMTVLEDETTAVVSPATVQAYVDLPVGRTRLQIAADLYPASDSFGMYPEMDDWDIRLYGRAEQPVLYGDPTGGAYPVERDFVVSPETTGKKRAWESVVWTLADLTPGQRYYLHFVNYGDSPAFIAALDVQTLE